jgi:hypothetical protein
LQVRRSACRRAARRTSEFFGAICINICEIYQGIAAVMVTVRGTQCMTRAKRKKNTVTAIWPLRLCHYDLFAIWIVPPASQFEPLPFIRRGACDLLPRYFITGA